MLNPPVKIAAPQTAKYSFKFNVLISIGPSIENWRIYVYKDRDVISNVPGAVPGNTPE
jgi:hypothetical protein